MPHRARIALTLLFFFSAFPAAAQRKAYRIGVLANRGSEECLSRWTPTARALSRTLGEEYLIVPLGFQEVDGAVRNQRVDYVVVNSGMYMALELSYGVQRIATLKSRVLGKAVARFGSVVFVRTERADIVELSDVRGKRVMAVEPDSFGGWLAAARELKALGLERGRDFRLEFGGIQDAPLRAVLDGTADVGIIRTDLLETLAREGKVDLKDLRILPPPSAGEAPGEDFPFLRSTRLYPEWPFAALNHVSREDAEHLLAALLTIHPSDEAARMGRYAGWTIPLSYEEVRDCLRELRYGPYADYGRVRPRDAVRSFWPWILSGFLLLGAAGAVALRMRTLNRELRKALSEVRTLSGMLPICASCKRIRGEHGGWTQIEVYVQDRSSAQFTHSICPDCVKKLYPNI